MDATPFAIRPLTADPAVLDDLASVLIEAVASGGSVSFMDPLSRLDADLFWSQSLAAAERGERIVLGAFENGRLVGTASLLLNMPPNQPHRAEIAKLMVRQSNRKQGVARALLLAVENEARRHGRWLLVLDTATEGGASPLYESLGFQLAGEIPDFALKPQGGLTGSKFYWKRLTH